jgi:hypothetical protein
MAKEKKTVQKTAAKKPIALKKPEAANKETATPVKAKSQKAKYLAKVPEAYVFLCHDGQIFRDLNDLVNGFEAMSDEIFAYHCNEDKNDFACWITDIIGDNELAAKLKDTRTKSQAKEETRQRYYELTQLEG